MPSTFLKKCSDSQNASEKEHKVHRKGIGPLEKVGTSKPTGYTKK